MNKSTNPEESFEKIVDWAEKADEENNAVIHAQCASILESVYYEAHGSPTKNRGYYLQVDGLVEFLKGLEERHPFRLPNRKEVLGKRQPSFLESVLATQERLRVIETLRETLSASCEAVIVGGSMSYGPFYNIRKNIDGLGGSDVDIIAVSDGKGFDDPERWKLPGVAGFSDRVRTFALLFRNQRANLISQRFDIDGIGVSLHVFPKEEFRDIMAGQRIKADFEDTVDVDAPVLDYKAAPFERHYSRQRNFSGQDYFRELGPQESVPGGFVTKFSKYSIRNSELFPGIFQSLISPKFEVYWDSSGDVTDMVKEFECLMRQRFERESKVNPAARFLASHIRFELFSPLVIERCS
ncbi:MAG: hypothetical protein Q8Q11_01295 [bacterium]|nr:hypothetical protein [bacterium]MDZ4247765.1 hypothetical protein [Patescibacteria group bacterium]